MANKSEKIEKDGQTFYALIQIDFSLDPAFALGEREIGMGATATAMYDKTTGTITQNCNIHITPTGRIVIPPKGEHIDLSASTSHIDAATPRYWFTNDNYD